MQSNNSIETYAYGTSKVIVKMITKIITKKKKQKKNAKTITFDSIAKENIKKT